MLDNVIVIGYSGHSYVVIDTALTLGLNILGYCEVNRQLKNPFGLIYYGNETEDSFEWKDNVSYFVGIGDNNIRSQVANRIIKKNGKFTNIIHPSSSVSNSVTLGKGIFMSANVVVNALVNIGNQCILNTGCIVEHECTIGSTVHIGPGAVLAGNVTVGDYTFIGANTVVKQGVKIGNNVVIGAGTVVIRDIADGETVAGNPARRIK